MRDLKLKAIPPFFWNWKNVQPLIVPRKLKPAKWKPIKIMLINPAFNGILAIEAACFVLLILNGLDNKWYKKANEAQTHPIVIYLQ